MHGSNHVVYVCVSVPLQMREREVKLWDTRRFSGSLLSCALDSSPGYVWVPSCPGNPRLHSLAGAGAGEAGQGGALGLWVQP